MPAPALGLLVCGGRWHDMDYARLEILKLCAEDERIRMRVADSYADIAALESADFLITYTCDVIPAEREIDALEAFLARGRRWLALHGTNSVLRFLKGRGWEAPRSAPKFMQLLGSQFIAHPPIAPYRVEVSDSTHPLVADLEPFEVDDELYLMEYHGEHRALLHTRYRGEAPGFAARHWPGGHEQAPPSGPVTDTGSSSEERQLVMYLHAHRGGEVLYCTLGHCRGKYDMRPMIAEYPTVERGSWKLPVYRELLRRGIRWALTPVLEPAPAGATA
jgi:type 1 glutamine amidotransferase